MNQPNSKLLNDICLVSKQGTCLLDMRQVADKARELGLLNLVRIIEIDLSENKITTGNYYSAVSMLFGVQP